jgi:NAD-dependent dihydropyrimidine dehydrogenase PreA subunit
MRRDFPVLARPADCIACALCALVCPVEAVRMVEREPA